MTSISGVDWVQEEQMVDAAMALAYDSSDDIDGVKITATHAGESREIICCDGQKWGMIFGDVESVR